MFGKRCWNRTYATSFISVAGMKDWKSRQSLSFDELDNNLVVCIISNDQNFSVGYSKVDKESEWTD